MAFYKKISLDDEDSINLFTSLLVRYPELCSINYYPQAISLKLTFILRGKLKKSVLAQFSNELKMCICTYLYFEKNVKPKTIKINYVYEPGLTMMVITRDANTLTQKEISLIINLLHCRFDNFLISDGNAVFAEEDLLEQDDYIKFMLDNLQPSNIKNKIIALREEGRVLVFKQ